MPHSASAIANELIRRANVDGLRMTHMHLQKLIYIAHGWNLAVNGEPLVGTAPVASEHGPVFRDLYRTLGRYGTEVITQELRPMNGDARGHADFTAAEKAVMNKVYWDYAGFATFQLSGLTHSPDGPWYKVFHRRGRNSEIENERIRAHFVKVGKKARKNGRG